MATIITVHGTGATGPEEGQAWWQKGSEFENHIRELVESEDGTLNFQPMVWDGANSEISRRSAAARLREKAQQLEDEDEKYCLVGHSHGGSVIANMLIIAAAKRNSLRRLTRLITVGTPFVQSVKSFFLFSRTGLIGKSVLVCVASVLFAQLCLFLYYAEGNVFGTDKVIGKRNKDNYISLIILAIPYTVQFLVIYAGLWVINWRRFHMYRRRVLEAVTSTYASRLTCFYHRSDEAIGALKALKALNLQIFQRDFAVSPLSFVSVFALPFLLVILAASPSLIANLSGLVGGKAHMGENLVTRLGQIFSIFINALSLLNPILNPNIRNYRKGYRRGRL
jgi:hypothetical protein